ncbi:MAG: hypothetical protein JEZ09_01975 [Salinivirgaceae bacterium]|nr:hypothetical protein [Salinivirgaceae bacterium]
MLNLTYRKATLNDVDFIANSIVESDKSGSKFSKLQKIFGISEYILLDITNQILKAKVPGNEYFIFGHYIAEIDKQAVASIGTWVEAENNLSSNFIKINIYNSFFRKYFNAEASEKLKIISAIDITRDPNTLQMEFGFTMNKYRGFGILDKLIGYAINDVAKDKTFDKIQLTSISGNINGANAIKKAGFILKQEKISSDSKILDIFPGPGIILWEKQYDK